MILERNIGRASDTHRMSPDLSEIFIDEESLSEQGMEILEFESRIHESHPIFDEVLDCFFMIEDHLSLH